MYISGKCIAALVLPVLIWSGDISAQALYSKWNVGLDIGPLMGGTPQLLVDYHPHPEFGFSAAAGYMFRPIRGGVRVDDEVELLSSNGAYTKLGLRLQTPAKDVRRSVVAFLQLWYIRSAYNERAERLYYDSLTQDVERKTILAKGTVHGLAMTVGMDFPVGKKLALRGGMQLGYYKRDDHVGIDFLTVQPGFGSEAVFPEIRQQLMLGLMYKMGSTRRSAAAPQAK
jgi:hypothetical protein